jgi:hypothetical protein
MISSVHFSWRDSHASNIVKSRKYSRSYKLLNGNDASDRVSKKYDTAKLRLGGPRLQL